MTGMQELYEKRGRAIIDAWSDALLHFSDAAYFPMGVNRSRFSNPVFYHIDKASQEAVAWLFSTAGADAIPESVDDLCRVKAVQDIPREGALDSIFSLRGILEHNLRSAAVTERQRATLDERLESLFQHVEGCYDDSKDVIAAIRLREIERHDALSERRARRAAQQRS